MEKRIFVKKYYPEARKTRVKYGVSEVAILAQAAWESGWGRYAPGNMFFGVKDTDGVNGNEQLLITHEYSKKPNAPFKNIISVKPVMVQGVKMFRYTIKDYFRKYDTPEECFNDHAEFIRDNPRYKDAWEVRVLPDLFLKKIAEAGYATDPLYDLNMQKMAKTIGKLMLSVMGTKG